MIRKGSAMTKAAREFSGSLSEEEIESVADAVAAGKNSGQYDITALRNVHSFEDAVALTRSVVGEVQDAAEVIGSGFIVLPTDQKSRLVGVKFVILSVDFSPGDNGPFASMMVVTENGERLIVNDGSTGIYAQLEEWSVRLPAGQVLGGLVVRGLRRSDYMYTDDKGIDKAATTYYLNV